MPIRVECECGRIGKAKDEYAGRKMKCPKCGRVLRIPVPNTHPSDEPTFDVPADEWEYDYSDEEQDWSEETDDYTPPTRARRGSQKKKRSSPSIIVDGLHPLIVLALSFAAASSAIYLAADQDDREPLFFIAGLGALVLSCVTRRLLTIRKQKTGECVATFTQCIAGVPVYWSSKDITELNEVRHKEELDYVSLAIFAIGAIGFIVMLPAIGALLAAVFPACIAIRLFAGVIGVAWEKSEDQGAKFSVSIAGNGKDSIRVYRKASRTKVNAVLNFLRKETGKPFIAKSLGGRW